MPLTPAGYVDALRDQGAALAASCERDLAAHVPSCPGWTTSALLRHVGQVHRRAALMIRDHAAEEIAFDAMPEPPAPAELPDWFRDGVAGLAAALLGAGPDGPVWNWTSAPHTAAFWLRRMAHETAVHRWDAEAATTVASPLPGPLAVGGVDELLTVFLPEQLAGLPAAGLGGSLHLHSLDRPGEWLIELAPGHAEISQGHGRADAAVRATASDLALFLWNRKAATDLDVLGDLRVAERWGELLRW